MIIAPYVSVFVSGLILGRIWSEPLVIKIRTAGGGKKKSLVKQLVKKAEVYTKPLETPAKPISYAVESDPNDHLNMLKKVGKQAKAFNDHVNEL